MFKRILFISLIEIIIVLYFSIKPDYFSLFWQTDSSMQILETEAINKAPVNNRQFIKVKYGKYLGNAQNNYYGESFTGNLNIIWKYFLGSGVSLITRTKGQEVLFGAGWTGQPLLISEHNKDYLIIGSYDHNLKKISVEDGTIVWQYEYDDIIKSTGCFYINKTSKSKDEKYLIMQGSRLGIHTSFNTGVAPCYRAVSFITGKEVWKLNVKKTLSYSRDVDGTAIIINDTAYIGFENGLFTIINPDSRKASEHEGFMQPEIIKELALYNSKDNDTHCGNLVTESTPCRLFNHIYVTSGSGHVYGFNLKTREIDWDLYIHADLDGSPVVTSDSCLLVTIEKQYIPGQGGLMKLNPLRSPETCVDWYFPTGNRNFADWQGGVVGTAAISDHYIYSKRMAAFAGIDGFLYVVQYDNIDTVHKVRGPLNKHLYSRPELLFRYNIGPSISTPVFVGNRILAGSYQGLYLFDFDNQMNFKLLAYHKGVFESTPLSYNNRIYVASRDGYLYCFGDSIRHVAEEQAVVRKEAHPKDTVSCLPFHQPDMKLCLNNSINLTPELKHQLSEYFHFYKNKTLRAVSRNNTRVLIHADYYIIAGSFTIKSNADNFVKTLTGKGYKSEIVCYRNGFYYVSMDKAFTSEVADRKLIILKNSGYKDIWIYKK